LDNTTQKEAIFESHITAIMTNDNNINNNNNNIRKEKKAAVIGLGPAGLSAVKELKLRGFEVTGFDGVETTTISRCLTRICPS
jgi:NADPH-dependent glutamate synthase beta subunit-like oxidoreductase